MYYCEKVLIVEGKTDKRRVEEVLTEPVQIICTHGTMGVTKLDEILDQIVGNEFFILSDADKEGRNIRKWFKKYLSESTHIYIDPKYREVGNCPRDYLANVLMRHGFNVDMSLIMKGKWIHEKQFYDRGTYVSHSV